MARTVPARAKTASKAAPQAAAAPTAEWTILVYMAGDNDLDSFGGKDLNEMKKVGSSDRLNVVVQRDTMNEGAKRYHVRKGTTLKQDEVAKLGEINTGDPRVLQDFLLWGLETYPAKRTMVVLWNHGSGWDDSDIYRVAKQRGLNPVSASGGRAAGGGRFAVRRAATPRRFRGSFFLVDDAFQTETVGGQRRAIAFDDGAEDFLDSVELKKVFAAVAKKRKKKIDLLGMDACLMSMVENGVQVRGAAEIFCGSQEVEPGDGWPYDRLLKALAAKPDLDGRKLAGLIVKEFVASYAKSVKATQSAFDLAQLDAVVAAADALGARIAKAVAKHDDLALEGAIERARKQSQRYEHPDYVDLRDFSVQLASLWTDCAAEARAVQAAVDACVFANSAVNPEVRRSRGLSIYLPQSKLNSLYQRLDFAAGGWGKFLKTYYVD